MVVGRLLVVGDMKGRGDFAAMEVAVCSSGRASWWGRRGVKEAATGRKSFVEKGLFAVWQP